MYGGSQKSLKSELSYLRESNRIIFFEESAYKNTSNLSVGSFSEFVMFNYLAIGNSTEI